VGRAKFIHRNQPPEYTMRTALHTQQNNGFHPALMNAALTELNEPELAALVELDDADTETATEAANDATAEAATEAVPVSWTEMVSHRTALIRFAQRKLHDPMLAEDVVHDVFEAVISGRAKFGGRCALKSWLTAILKFKIVDLVRQRAGYDSLDASSDEDGEVPESLALRCTQPQPDEVTEQRQRLQQVLDRISALPESLRSVIELRVLQDRSTEDVCATLAISEDNLFVRLHRARKQLAS
jgi:RNA polymerase sigma-70 factor, ECF subfamily